MTLPSTPDGLLLVDKPAGVSSHDMVLAARRALRERRIGHAGTLDPFATGLLVLLVGRATRLLPYLPGEPKRYLATIVFGAATDTDDLLGTVTQERPLPSRDAVRAAVASMVGPLLQRPSTYSAKRIEGRRAYELARQGAVVELAPVAITVHRWDILEWIGTDTAVAACTVDISCSGGTYVRALARDLGETVGSAAHLSTLRRVASGPFHVDEAVTLAQLREGDVSMRPAGDALPQWESQALSDDDLQRVVRGIAIPATVPGPYARLVSERTGVLLALGERREGLWQPRVVMRPGETA
jgi:tRNA pseudouridine55 synthase